MDGFLVVIGALGDVLAAYKARVAELERIVQTQQSQITDLQATKGAPDAS